MVAESWHPAWVPQWWRSFARVLAPPTRRPVPLLPSTHSRNRPVSPLPPGRPATRRLNAVLAQAQDLGPSAQPAWDAASTRLRGAPVPSPALPGAAGAQQAGMRQGGRRQARHPEEARAAGIRPMALRRGGAARQECPARAQVASCPPPARGPDPGAREGGPGPASF